MVSVSEQVLEKCGSYRRVRHDFMPNQSCVEVRQLFGSDCPWWTIGSMWNSGDQVTYFGCSAPEWTLSLWLCSLLALLFRNNLISKSVEESSLAPEAYCVESSRSSYELVCDMPWSRYYSSGVPVNPYIVCESHASVHFLQRGYKGL